MDQTPKEHSPRFYPCKGACAEMSRPDTRLSPRQTAWMLENKPIYYTGDSLQDFPHLPRELRFV